METLIVGTQIQTLGNVIVTKKNGALEIED